MEIVFLIVGGLFLIGAGLALYEWRKGRTILKHDLNATGPQSEADREAIRAEDALRNRHNFDHMS